MIGQHQGNFSYISMSSGKDRHTNTLLLPDFIQFFCCSLYCVRGDLLQCILGAFHCSPTILMLVLVKKSYLIAALCKNCALWIWSFNQTSSFFMASSSYFLLGSSFGAKCSYRMKINTIANNRKDWYKFLICDIEISLAEIFCELQNALNNIFIWQNIHLNFNKKCVNFFEKIALRLAQKRWHLNMIQSLRWQWIDRYYKIFLQSQNIAL